MKILMVCLGNICRSPMAEGIMRNLGGKKVEVDSAGTASYHIGFQPDKRMIATAFDHGIDISNLRARQFQYDDFNSFDRTKWSKGLTHDTNPNIRMIWKSSTSHRI